MFGLLITAAERNRNKKKNKTNVQLQLPGRACIMKSFLSIFFFFLLLSQSTSGPVALCCAMYLKYYRALKSKM